MGIFDILKKKSKSSTDDFLGDFGKSDFESKNFKDFQSSSSESFESLLQSTSQSQQSQQTFQSSSQIQSTQLHSDKISLIESKIENLRIYLEMINSKLDKLETLLRSRGLI